MDDHGYDLASNSPSFQLQNPHITNADQDYLYHLGLSIPKDNLQAKFGDIKCVCLSGSTNRIKEFAQYLSKQLDVGTNPEDLQDLCSTDRYSLYKVGPVLCLSHGMGIPSISIVLNELLKLLYHAKCEKTVRLIRLGTSGGLDLEPGTVVITKAAVDYKMDPYFEMVSLGKVAKYPSDLDESFAKELEDIGKNICQIPVVRADTMCSNGFFEDQGRLDGAFCDFSEDDKMNYLKESYEKGIRNIEMESLCFAAYCNRANLKGAVVCVILLDRLKGDQIATIGDWYNRPQMLVAEFIKNKYFS